MPETHQRRTVTPRRTAQRRLRGATLAVATLAFGGLFAAPAGAAQPADAAPAASSAPTAQSADTRAAGCGFHTEGDPSVAKEAYWKNCSASGDLVNVDLVMWPDEQRCVPAGADAHLGGSTIGAPLPPVGLVRGASAVGTC